MDDLGAIRLMNAIVAQAMKDYTHDRVRRAKYGDKKYYSKYNCKEVVKFLKSGYGEMMLGSVDADYLIRECDIIADKAIEEKTRAKLSNSNIASEKEKIK